VKLGRAESAAADAGTELSSRYRGALSKRLLGQRLGRQVAESLGFFTHAEEHVSNAGCRPFREKEEQKPQSH
jgi:hypothetical protein